VAEYADVETMRILANKRPMKASYDLSSSKIESAKSLLAKRVDYDVGLEEAFQELIDIATSEKPEAKAIEAILEATWTQSARSSYHSALTGAASRLHSLQTSPAVGKGDEKSQWTDSVDIFHSPSTPTFGDAFSDSLLEKGL
jgi:energy-converting hydrogenase A subunit M